MSQFQSLAMPWGGWSPNSSPLPDPTGWPGAVSNPGDYNAPAGCVVMGPMTVQQARNAFWQIEEGLCAVTVQLNPPDIDSDTNAQALRWSAEPPSGGVIASGAEALLITDQGGAVGGTASVHGWWNSGFTGGGVTWTFKMVNEFVWCDPAIDVAFISVRAFLDWTKSGGVELSFQATHEPTAFEVGGFNYEFGSVPLYATTDLGGADFLVELSQVSNFAYDP